MDDIMRCHSFVSSRPPKTNHLLKMRNWCLSRQFERQKRKGWDGVTWNPQLSKKCFTKIWQLLHTVLGVQKVNVWNRVKRHEVDEDTLQTEDETMPWHTIVSWRQNRFSTGEGQEMRINLSANYRLVTADISNNGESTTKNYKYYNVTL